MEQFVTNECSPLFDWQMSSFPSCNKLHEIGLSHSVLSYDGKNDNTSTRIINHGYFRDVWTISDTSLSSSLQVLKTLRYEHDYIDRNYDRHRRDAVATERLTSSPYIVNIYGYCANNGLFEFSEGGDIDHALFTQKAIDNPMSKYDRLRIATQVANAIADAHHTDPKTGQASIAHTDITGSQFIFINGIFKLNDFNRARFLRWNEKENKPCGFKVGANRGDFRSPEEYAYAFETEKVDVYSMGNIFFQLINLQFYLFPNVKEKDIFKKVMKGERPTIKASVLKSKDPVDKVFVKAIEMSYVHDPKLRPSARKIADFLTDELSRIPYPGLIPEQ